MSHYRRRSDRRHYPRSGRGHYQHHGGSSLLETIGVIAIVLFVIWAWSKGQA